MRLLITTDTVGGVWRFALELTQGLLAEGDAVALASFGRRALASQREECTQLRTEWGDLFEYSEHDIPLEWMQDNQRCFTEGAPVLLRMARTFGAELLHCNQFCYGAVEIEVPKVVTAHSDVLSWARACRGSLPEPSAWLERYCSLVAKGLRGADAVTTPTAWMLDELDRNFPVRVKALAVPNGRTLIAPDVSKPHLRAVTIGRLWDEAKDVALLTNIRSPMPLVVAGDTECDGKQLIPMHGISFCGVLSEREVLRLFAESAMYVCTSKYEPFGLAPLEAALCGCAIVARDIPSLREVWGNAALWFNTAEELSALLKWLSEDRDSLCKAQHRASQHARQFSRERMVRSYREIYAAVKETACVA